MQRKLRALRTHIVLRPTWQRLLWWVGCSLLRLPRH